MPARLTTFLTLVPLTALLLSGCGAQDVIDQNKSELAVRYAVEDATGEKVSEVTCPENVPVSVGNRFTCHVVSKSGRDAVIELEVTSESGDLRALSLKAP